MSTARTNASTTSSTYTKSRVCEPSPKIIGRSRVEQLAREDRDDPGFAVRVLARAVHVGQRERRVLEPADCAVVVEVVADGLLRDAVGRLRVLRRGLRGSGAPRGCRRACRPSAANTILLDAGRDRALAHVERAEDVDRRVEHRARDRHAHVGLRGEVEDHVGPAVRDEIDDRRRRDVEAVEREAAIGLSARASARFAERAGREVVDDVDAPALGEEPVDERRADEPGAAGDQRLHRPSRSLLALGGDAARPRSACPTRP